MLEFKVDESGWQLYKRLYWGPHLPACHRRSLKETVPPDRVAIPPRQPLPARATKKHLSPEA